MKKKIIMALLFSSMLSLVACSNEKADGTSGKKEEQKIYPKEITFELEGDMEYIWTFNKEGNISEAFIKYSEDHTEEWNVEYVSDEDKVVYGIDSMGFFDTASYLRKGQNSIEKIPLVEKVSLSSNGVTSFNGFSLTYEGVFEYDYDKKDRLTEIAYIHDNSAHDVNSYTFEFEYDDDKWIMCQKYIDNETRETLEFENENVIGETYWFLSRQGEISEEEYKYEYNEDENLVKQINGDGYVQIYAYDKNGNFVEGKNQDGYIWHGAEYDKNGNIIEATNGDWTTLYKYNKDEQLVEVNQYNGSEEDTWMYTYDSDGNLTSVDLNDEQVYTFDYNEDGLLENFETTTGGWTQEISNYFEKNVHLGNLDTTSSYISVKGLAELDMEVRNVVSISIEY